MSKQTRVPVTTRAVIQRINRVLAKDGEVLKVTRGERARPNLGDHYILDLSLNAVVRHDVDVESMARKLGVLHDYEQVVQ